MAAITAAVITVSDRSFAGSREDTSGPLLRDLLLGLGLAVSEVVLVPDEVGAIASAVASAAAYHAVVVTTRRTRLSPRDALRP